MDYRNDLEDTAEHDFSAMLGMDTTVANARWGRISDYGRDVDSAASRMANERVEDAFRHKAEQQMAARIADAKGPLGRLAARLGMFEG